MTDTPISATLIATLNRQLQRAGRYAFYRRHWDQNPAEITCLDDFARIPMVPYGAFAEDAHQIDPPRGSFFGRDVVRINLTPSSKGLRPIYFSAHDLVSLRRANAELLRRAGVTEDDVAITTLSYSLLPAGLMIQDAFEELGAKIIPVGPGETERTVALMRDWKVSVIYGNPSYAMRLHEAGAPPIRVLIAGGEPFSAIPGYKDAVRNALGSQIVLIESYGLAEAGTVARECRHQRGLHVAVDYAYLEVVDPASGEPLPRGEVGEIVVTHLDKEIMPLVRYRTGDLGMLDHVDCPCGRTLTLVGGIRGRADAMRKVKGVKLYPAQIRQLLDQDDTTRGRAFRLQISDGGSTQQLSLILEGPPLPDDALAGLRARFRKEVLIIPNDVRYEAALAAGAAWLDDAPPRPA